MPLQRLVTRSTPKPTKAAARYTPAGGAERCGMCRHFAAPSACSRILGPVSASGWCMYFGRQVTYQDHAGVQSFGAGGPSLDLDLMNVGALDPRITFTRASTATYFDAAGTLQTAATNAPRWDYNLSTLALNGLLLEEARTNLMLNSGDMSNATWTKEASVVAAPVVTGNQTTAPDGTLTASRIVFPAVSVASNYSVVYDIMTVTAVVYTFSVWLKGAVGGEQTYLYIPTTASRLRVTLTTAWQRFVVTSASVLPAGSGYAQIGTDLRDGGQASTPAQTIYAWGAQFEAGAFATSYIPTTAATVTRAQDQCYTPTGTWYNAAASTIEVETVSPVAASANYYQVQFSLDGGVTNNRALIYRTATSNNLNADMNVGGSDVYAPVIGALTPGQITKAALAFQAGTQRSALNSVLASTGVQAIPAGMTRLNLGQSFDGTQPLNGYMRRVRYWPRVLTNAELQSVTA